MGTLLSCSPQIINTMEKPILILTAPQRQNVATRFLHAFLVQRSRGLKKFLTHPQSSPPGAEKGKADFKNKERTLTDQHVSVSVSVCYQCWRLSKSLPPCEDSSFDPLRMGGGGGVSRPGERNDWVDLIWNFCPFKKLWNYPHCPAPPPPPSTHKAKCPTGEMLSISLFHLPAEQRPPKTVYINYHSFVFIFRVLGVPRRK